VRFLKLCIQAYSIGAAYTQHKVIYAAAFTKAVHIGVVTSEQQAQCEAAAYCLHAGFFVKLSSKH
jgi:hypothetical protein